MFNYFIKAAIQNFSISQKLLLTFSIVIFFLFIEFLGSFYFEKQIIDGLTKTYDLQNLTFVLQESIEGIENLSGAFQSTKDQRVVRVNQRIFETRYLATKDLLSKVEHNISERNELLALYNQVLESFKQIGELSNDFFSKLIQKQSNIPILEEEVQEQLLLIEHFKLQSIETLGKIRLKIQDETRSSFEETYSQRNVPILIGVFLTATLTILIIIISYSLSRQIINPINNLIEATQVIARGDLTKRATVISNDEIGVLTQHFNKMTHDLFLATEKEKELAREQARRSVEQKRRAELEKAYEELKKTQNQLVQAEKLSSIGQLAAGVAHELNSPITGLLNLLTIYKSQAKDGTKEYEDVNDMLEATIYMASIVTNLTAFSRQPKGELTEINLNEVIETTLSFAAFHLTKNKIKIIKNYSSNLFKILGEKEPLQQVVLNLITNARDAMLNGGEFVINTQNLTDTNEVMLEFIDSGEGIKEEDMTKIFDPFFTTKSTGKGTGLGLFVTSGIVQNYKGRILVTSTIGKGTKFTLFFPGLS